MRSRILRREQANYVSNALTGVSRSFALVIPTLEEPLDHIVGVAYLICRVCDNIEDCVQSLEWKKERWVEMRLLLESSEQALEVLQHWETLDWPGLTDEERALMGRGGEALWEIFAQLPKEDSAVVLKWVVEMAEGMEWMLSPESPQVQREGVAVLRDLNAFDRYCYYVAGTVGQMCTGLTTRYYGLSQENCQHLESLANAFGRALQKTNILKDFARDLQRGACYFPNTWMEKANNSPLRLEGAPRMWKAQVIRNILGELDDAVEYIASLPLEAAGYRTFCLRAVLPAYQTMICAVSKLDSLFTKSHQCKIDKSVMFQCLEDAEEFTKNNALLLEARKKYIAEIESFLPQN